MTKSTAKRRLFSSWISKTALVLAALAGAIGLTYWGFQRYFPLEIAEKMARWDLWRGGVSHLESAGLSAYHRDLCHLKQRPDQAAAAPGCTCVALIHGLGDNALTWKRVLLAPEKDWNAPVNLFAWDLPGSGRSPAPQNPTQDYRVRNQAAALHRALAPLCHSWLVVGNSLGGWIASWLALDWPEGVSKVILVDSAGLKHEASPSEPKQAPLLSNATIESMKEFQAKAYYKPRPLPESVWQAAAARAKFGNIRQVEAAQTEEDALDGRLGALHRPTLLIWGEADRIISPSVGLTMKSQIPGAIWRLIPRCGHLPQKECPGPLIQSIADMARFGLM